MKLAMHDKFADGHGLMDFQVGASLGGKSRQAETRRFLGALKRISERKEEASWRLCPSLCHHHDSCYCNYKLHHDQMIIIGIRIMILSVISSPSI
jgi:hypothetical protein